MLRKQKKWCFVLLSMAALFVFAAEDDEILSLNPFAQFSEKKDKGNSGSQDAPRAETEKSKKSSSSRRRMSGREKIRQKLKEIILDRVTFEEVGMTTALLYLHERSKEKDPEGVGIKFKFQKIGKNRRSSDDDGIPALTLMMSNVTLETAIIRICRTAKCTYRINDDGVTIIRRR